MALRSDVAFIPSVRGGRPEAGWSDLEIHHPVSDVSRGDIVAVENQADMAAFCIVTLMKASSCNYCRPTCSALRKTLGSGLPDRMMVALWCRFSIGSVVCGAALEDRGCRWNDSHVWPTGATMCHTCSAGATHERFSKVFMLG